MLIDKMRRRENRKRKRLIPLHQKIASLKLPKDMFVS